MEPLITDGKVGKVIEPEGVFKKLKDMLTEDQN